MADTNPEEVERAISYLLSGRNESIRQAEDFFKSMDESPTTLLLSFLEVMEHHANENFRQAAAVVFKKKLTAYNTDTWAHVTPAAKNEIRNRLPSIVMQESSVKVMRSSSFLVAMVLLCSMKEGWPELLPWLFDMSNSERNLDREAALTIFHEISPYLLGKGLEESLEGLKFVLGKSLEDSCTRVQRCAVETFCGLIITVKTKQDRAVFVDLVEKLLQAVSSALSNGRADDSDFMLGILNELVEQKPSFFKNSLRDLSEAMFEVANCADLGNSTRKLASEIIITLCEGLPGSMSKIEGLVPAYTHLQVEWLLTFDPNVEWDKSLQDSETDVSLYDAGLNALDRLGTSMDPEELSGVLMECINELMQNDDWHFHFAATQTIIQTAEGCCLQFQDHLTDIVSLAASLTKSESPYARWSALGVFGQLSIDMAPDFQQECFQEVIPCVIQCMEDESQRVLCQCTTVLQNFFDISDDDFVQHSLSQYMDDIFEKLLGITRNGARYTQENAICAISSMAESLEGGFAPYYDQATDILKEIITNCHGKEERQLRGRAFECFSLICQAVGIEKCHDDALAVLDLIMDAGPDVSSEDPQSSMLHTALVRLAQVLGQDFLPYFRILAPIFFQTLRQEVKMIITEEDEEAPKRSEGWDTLKFDFKGIGAKRISIQTFILQEYVAVLEKLLEYITLLKESYQEFLTETIETVVPLIQFRYLPEVRRLAGAMVPEMIHIYKSLGDVDSVASLFDFAFPVMYEAVQVEREIDAMVVLMDSLGATIKNVGSNFLSSEQIESLCELISTLLQNNMSSRRKVEKAMEDEDLEEGDDVLYMEELESFNLVLSQWGEIIGAMLKTHDDFLPLFMEKFFPMIKSACLDPSSAAIFHQVAVCVTDDLVSMTPVLQEESMVPEIMAMFAAHTDHKDNQIRQSAIFGIRLVVEHIPEALWPRFEEDIVALLHRLTDEGVHKPIKQYGGSQTNAVVGLWKVASRFQGGGGMSADDIYAHCLQLMPLRGDTKEVQYMNENVLDMIESEYPLVASVDALPHLLDIILFSWGTRYATKEIRQRMVQCMQHFLTTYGEDAVMASWDRLSEKFQSKLREIVSLASS